MARYYFHVKDGAELIKDQEGSELPTPDAARRQALKSARELWADAIKPRMARIKVAEGVQF